MKNLKISTRILSLALIIFLVVNIAGCSKANNSGSSAAGSTNVTSIFSDEEKAEIAALQGNTGYSTENVSEAKNVILVITDGYSVDMGTLTRLCLDPTGQTPLEAQKYVSGHMNISWANGPITDSAAAASAMATGTKTNSGMVGTSIINNEYQPFASVTEAARLAGKKTGLVATVELFHATPAGFSAHTTNRNDYENISEQLAYSGIDVLLGGGNDMDPTGSDPSVGDLKASSRVDGEDLIAEIESKGYKYITTKDEMNNVSDGKVWGAFTAGAFPFEVDDMEDALPTLEEMSMKAIDLLNKDNENGFFLMVEASHIDHGGHNNDPVAVISETISWNNAMKSIMEFAKQDGNTVVLSTSDHATGGLRIGSVATNSSYSTLPADFVVGSLQKSKYTADHVIGLMQSGEMTAKEAYKAYGLDPDVDDFSYFKDNPTSATLKEQLNYKSGLAFTTGGHTGEDIMLYGYSPNNDHPHGFIDNTELTDYMCKALGGLDLMATTSELYVNLTEELTALGYELKYSDYHDLTATKDGKTIEIPVNKNYCMVNGEKHELKGYNVYYYSSSDLMFGCREIVDLAK